jgi:hypothetical protein
MVLDRQKSQLGPDVTPPKMDTSAPTVTAIVLEIHTIFALFVFIGAHIVPNSQKIQTCQDAQKFLKSMKRKREDDEATEITLRAERRRLEMDHIHCSMQRFRDAQDAQMNPRQLLRDYMISIGRKTLPSKEAVRSLTSEDLLMEYDSLDHEDEFLEAVEDGFPEVVPYGCSSATPSLVDFGTMQVKGIRVFPEEGIPVFDETKVKRRY